MASSNDEFDDDEESYIQPQTQVEKQTITELKTAPYDPRFPNANQTKHCYFMFIDYHRCTQKHGLNYEACNYFKNVYTSLCPNAWVEKWTEQIKNGAFPFQFERKDVEN